ncbi:uncharacterized protein N7503_011898 [Penicillium pulvis]|uniref:uncharacterized protein n=1 Tax=Penicillium pulvis TaxID=1562058 RepID=UPI00254955F0|nr:uncharacterized protein N7503_011898 [Penicillium pulvis]KAJ5786686.1 hypothetical protein N7503_011898 [Penicillium pulvis]
MSSFANMDIPDLDLPRSVSMSGSPEVSSVFSPNTSWDGLSGSSSFTHDNLSHHLYTGDTLAAKDDIPISEALLLPTTGIDIASSGDSIQNPANFEYGTSYVESKLPCHANEQNSSSDLRWQEMFDRMIQSSGSAPRDCQCLDRALELLDGLFVQHGNSANPLSTFKSKYHQTSDAMQKLSFLRMELNAFEGIASCAQCKKTRCLMGLLVLLSERLSTLFRQIFEIMPLSTFQAGIDFENTSSPMPSNEDLSNIGEKEIQPREYETGSHFRTKTEERNTKMILSCNGFTLDMSKETEALLLHLALLAMQQLRKVIATLWGRAQDEQRKDLSENLSQCGQRLHNSEAV